MTNLQPIVDALSEAQRRWLTDNAEHRELWNDGVKRWVTFPPSNTHRVLHQLGLVLAIGLITERGMQVRAHLIAHPTKDRG